MASTGGVLVGLGDAAGGVPELDWAAREAVTRNASLRVIRAYHLTWGTLPWESSSDRMFTSELRQHAQKSLDAALAHVHQAWPDLEVEGQVVDGIAWDVLRAAAADAAVTVLGSRHHGALGSALLGSVSTVVAASAPGPVVVAGYLPGDQGGDPVVVVGVDGSERTPDVLDFAFDYASRHNRRLRAIFCWHPDLLASMQWRMPPPAPERAERWLAEALAGHQENYPEVLVHRAVLREFPVAGLVAESLSQELLVVGNRSQHARVAALLGSVSQGVLHHAGCPVAIVHPRATPYG